MANLQTTLSEKLGLEKPIVQAPISASPSFVAAVCNAGGLGMIQATWLEAEELRQIIASVRRQTDKPFGANFVLPLIEPDGYRLIDVALDEGVKIISTFWGDPAPVIQRIHAASALSFHTIGSAVEAKRVVEQGVDGVVAQGVEAGGHVWGEVGTLALVPAVVDAVPGTPVIAAGGIADGRGLAAVLALGAEAAWIGTRLLLAEEVETHPDARQRLIDAQGEDTIHTELFDGGWPAAPSRVLINSTVRDWMAAGQPEPGTRPNEGEVLTRYDDGTPVVRYDISQPRAGMPGDVEPLAHYAGQGVGLVRAAGSVSDILATMMEEAEETLSRLQ